MKARSLGSFPPAQSNPARAPLDAATRETLEEVGLDFAANAVLGERVHSITDRHMVYVQCHAPEPNNARLVDSDELAELEWCTWAEVRDRIPAGIFNLSPTTLHTCRADCRKRLGQWEPR